MGQLVTLEGYLDSRKGEVITILCLDGTRLQVSSKAVHRFAPIDASKEPLTRFFLDQDAEISITLTAGDLVSAGASRGGTILKWLDDGGTIYKSRDDG